MNGGDFREQVNSHWYNIRDEQNGRDERQWITTPVARQFAFAGGSRVDRSQQTA
jgi:hypothetical protein